MTDSYYSFAIERIIHRTNNELAYYQKYRQEMIDDRTYLLTHGTILDSQSEIDHKTKIISLLDSQIQRIKESSADEIKQLDRRFKKIQKEE